MTHIEMRTKEAGFVYTRRTRLLLTPKFTVTRREADISSSDLVLCAASNWPVPASGDIGRAIKAVKKKFPDRKIFADGAGGLVLVYEPPPVA